MKLSKIFAIAAVLAVVSVALTGCVTTSYEKQLSGQTINMGTIPAKDFEVVGPVTATSTEVVTSSLFSKTHIGSEMVSSLLMEEAIKLGAHDVINIKITKREDSHIVLFGIFGSKRIYTYTATGLAIKYTDTLKNGDGSQVIDENAYFTNYNGDKKVSSPVSTQPLPPQMK